ncbi:MAG: glycosyltransferase [bacterium]|nr:glycosyltransferase [bacterium]
MDLQAWSPEKLPAAPTRDAYLYFGRISHEKGVRFALEAQQLWERGHAEGTIDEPPLELLIAGTGPCDGNLRAKAAQLELRNVQILGPLQAPALREAMARSRFTILPSVCYENGPMAALESLASGVPVVGSRIGGIPEMIDEGVTGYTVAPGEPSAILSGLLKAAALSDSARTAAREWACRNAGRVEHMAKLQAILEAAAGR